MAVSTTATQQALRGKQKKEMLWATVSDSEKIRPQAPGHAATHRHPWEGWLPELRESFLAPLEKMLPGEKQAKQNPNTTV